MADEMLPGLTSAGVFESMYVIGAVLGRLA
jgi:hypothetical protein